MKRTSCVNEGITNSIISYSNQDTLDIINAVSSLHRTSVSITPASYEELDETKKERLCEQINQPISTTQLPSEVWSIILSYSSLKTIFSFQLISKLFSTLANNTDYSCIKVETMDDVMLLQKLLSNQLHQVLAAHIQGFNFMKLEIDSGNNALIQTLLNTINQNLNITKLILGNIDSKINLPNLLKNLVSLSLGNIKVKAKISQEEIKDFGKAIVIFPDLNNLTRLTIGNISAGAYISFPALDNLKTLIIGNIGGDAIINLALLSNLSTLILGDVRTGVLLRLHDSFKNIKNVITGTVHDDVTNKILNARS